MKDVIVLPAVGFVTLLICFWLVAKHFGVTIPLAAALSAALLLTPYWAFGFGVRTPLADPFGLLLLLVPYLVYALPAGQFRWSIFFGFAALLLGIGCLLHRANSASSGIANWRDWFVLALLAIPIEFRFFDRAWPIAGLSGLPKLLLVDAALYGYLVIRPLPGIGFDFRIARSDIVIGLREFIYFTPIALLLGFALNFLHLHRTPGSPLAFAAGWLFTLFFVAVPEELFFRGLMLNMLEQRLGTSRALAIASLLFGLAHFNKRTTNFNWRYVILAVIAGVFYGRAWLSRRRVIASSITHATVDTVWSIWLR